MLRARKRGIFKRRYEVESGDGPLTTLAGGRREGCTFELGGGAYRIEREGRKRFLLFGPEGRIATADRDTGREWTLKSQAGNLKLAKPSFWRSHWEIRRRGSAKGTIRHEGVFSSTYTAEVPADVPLPVAVFTLYVVLVFFERAAASAAAAGA
jgi:hypothetical protein